jgi:hypothetical protein
MAREHCRCGEREWTRCITKARKAAERRTSAFQLRSFVVDVLTQRRKGVVTQRAFEPAGPCFARCVFIVVGVLVMNLPGDLVEDEIRS